MGGYLPKALARRHALHSEFRAAPLWEERRAGEPPAALAPLEPAAGATLVVGSGPAALSAALELARSGRAVSLAAALPLTGDAGDLGPRVADGLAARLAERARARAVVEALVERESIACDLTTGAHVFAAAGLPQLDRLRHAAAALAASGVAGIELLGPERRGEVLGSAYWIGGLVLPGEPLLHPGRYARGLLAACVRAGVRVGAAPAPARLEAAARASAAIVVTVDSAPSTRLAASLAETGGMVRVSTRPLVATEPIPLGLVRSQLERHRSVSEDDGAGYFARTAPDGERIVFGRRRPWARWPRESAIALYPALVERFPALRGVRLTHGWSAPAVVADPRAPRLGGTGTTAWCLAGLDVVTDSYLGWLAARALLGDVRESAYRQPATAPSAAPGAAWIPAPLRRYLRS